MEKRKAGAIMTPVCNLKRICSAGQLQAREISLP